MKKEEWLKDLSKLQGLLHHVDDPEFQKRWAAVKQSNKERLARHVENTLGVCVIPLMLMNCRDIDGDIDIIDQGEY